MASDELVQQQNSRKIWRKRRRLLRPQVHRVERSRFPDRRAVQLLDNSTDAFFSFDRHWRFSYINSAAESMLARPRAAILGKKVWEEYPQAVGTKFYIELREAAAKKQFVYGEYHSKRMGGWLEIRIYPSLRGVDIQVHDMTRRKVAEEQVRQSQAQFSQLFRTNPAAMSILRLRDLTYVDVNKAWEKNSGYNRNEVIGKTPEELNVLDRGGSLSIYHKAAKQRRHDQFEYSFRRKDGCMSISVCNTESVEFNGEKCIIFAAIDITERKRVEQELAKSQHEFMTLVENVPDAISRIDKDLRYLYVNPAIEAHVGIPARNLIGKRVDEMEQECFAQLVKPFQTVFRSGVACTFEAVFPLQNGERYCEIRVIPERIIAGQVETILVIDRDITDRIGIEEEIARIERLNLIGEMAASIGHEVRNPMTTVRGYLQMMGRKNEFDKYKSQLLLMIDELDRANSIITEFLSLAKNKQIALRMTNLNEVLQTIFPLLQATVFHLGSQVQLCLADIPALMLDAKEIRQYILNLVQNAVEAMPMGGLVTIKTLVQEGQVVLAVCDNGTGIPNHIMERLGTPFNTSKDSGTGLGLAVCYSIAERHNAKICVETGSTGTSFFMRFKGFVG